MLEQAARGDSHLMFKALLQHDSNKGSLEPLRIAAREASYECFCLLIEPSPWRHDLEVLSLGIELSKSNPARTQLRPSSFVLRPSSFVLRPSSFVLRLLKGIDNFDSLCAYNDRRWVMENILAYPSLRTADQMEQYRALIEYVVEEMSSCTTVAADFMIAAA